MLTNLTIKDVFSEIWGVLVNFNWLSDLLDVLLVALVIYGIVKLIRDSKAIQLVKGLVFLGALYAVVTLLDMQASSYLFSFLFGNILIILVIIFAPEIRHALESVGRSSVIKFGLSVITGDNNQKQEQMTLAINSVCKAAAELSVKKIGALIAFENETNLGEIIKTGTLVDAIVTSEILGNVFYPKSPLHDGAVIIREARVCAAGCILPLTFNKDISRELGTRHRAAIGLSEESDAIIVVISEETGAISFAYKGRLKRGISESELREMLSNQFLSAEKEDREQKHKKRIKEKNNKKNKEEKNEQ